ncbi:MAG: M12 family metallo-peptidase [Planctomycetota bacterium]|jgi:hypothetical protein
MAGLGAVWPGSPSAQTQPEVTVPQVPQLLGFDMAELALPEASGQPFNTTVSLNGQLHSLELEPYTLRAPDFQLLVDRGDGQLEPVEPVPPSTYQGTVQGVPGSRVAASLIDGRLWATINLDEETVWQVEPLSELAGPDAPEGFHAIYRDTDTVPLEGIWCGTTDDMRVPPDGGDGGDGSGGGGIALAGERIIDYAADADVEFWQKNGSSELNTMLDIEMVVNQMESIYRNQLNAVFEITTIVVRTGSTGSDPYSSNNCSTLLGQFTSNWTTSPEVSIRRDAAQLYTGRNLSGCLGIAWVGTVCNIQSHYSVVESRASGLNLTLRTALSGHELGHNFSASHCCGSCSGCSACRIMCPCIAGCSGIMTSFGTQAVTQITSYINSQGGCLGVLGPTIGVPFFDAFPSTNLDTDKWSYNDGGLVTSIATNEPSPPNSLNLDSSGSGAYQDNEVRSNFIDLVDLDDVGVFVSYYTQHKNVDAGEMLSVEYWTGSLWSPLNTIISDGVDEADFTLWVHDLTGMFPSPFHSEFRLRFRTDGNSSGDDWYIDDVVVGFDPPPDNDDCENAEVIVDSATAFSTIGATTDGVPETCGGGIGNQFESDVWFLYTAECTGTATFSVCGDADFDTRLAVYNQSPCPPFSDLACSDDASGCGQTSEVQVVVFDGSQYLVRVGSGDAAIEGAGTLNISCEPLGNPCPWDCGDPADGLVDVVDFLALLAQWGQVGASCDINGGGVDVTDFLELIGSWGACP